MLVLHDAGSSQLVLDVGFQCSIAMFAASSMVNTGSSCHAESLVLDAGSMLLKWGSALLLPQILQTRLPILSLSDDKLFSCCMSKIDTENNELASIVGAHAPHGTQHKI